MSIEEPPNNPDGLSPYGSLPGDEPQPTPDDSSRHQPESIDPLRKFIDLDELDGLDHDQKVRLVQIVSERFVFSHLSGMNGTIGYSETLRPNITDRKVVAGFRDIAFHLWGQGSRLPDQMRPEDIARLRNHISDRSGDYGYFASIIKPPEVEPHPKNPYLAKESLAYHDARLLDALINELYLQPNSQDVQFGKN